MIWTDEMDATLANMRKGGFSSSKIAAHVNKTLGNGAELVTRNAVVGRAYRLACAGKMDKIEKPIGYGKFSRRDPKPKAVTVARVKAAPEPPAQPVKRDLPAVLTVMVEKPKPRTSARPVPLMECSGCRWPVNDTAPVDQFLFCNADPKPGKPYCDDHCAVAYTGRARVSQSERRKLHADWRF